MTDKTLEKDISEKLVIFEKDIVAEKKTTILDSLIKEKPSTVAQMIFVFNSALLGLSLGKILSISILEQSNVTVLGVVLYASISLASLRYIKHYFKREENKNKVIKEISALRSLKGIKQYLQNLSDKFKYSFLFLNNENLESLQKYNEIIKNEEIKSFIVSLNKEQLDFLMDVLKKNTLEEGFNIQLIGDIKKLCLTQNKSKIQEEKLLNTLKVLTGDIIDKDSLSKNNAEENNNIIPDISEDDDLLHAMSETYLPDNVQNDKKIDFKKIL